MLQWCMTALLVAGCSAYALRTLLPKVAQAAGGCHCSGCEHAAGAPGRAGPPCASASSNFQPVVFHPRLPPKS